RLGRDLDHGDVLLLVDRDEGAVEAEVRHDLDAGQKGGQALLRLLLALLGAAELEEDEHGESDRDENQGVIHGGVWGLPKLSVTGSGDISATIRRHCSAASLN